MRAHLTAQQADAITGWRKSSHSGGNGGDCVEITAYNDGVAIRNSNDPESGALAFTGPEFRAFVAGVRDGEFDTFL